MTREWKGGDVTRIHLRRRVSLAVLLIDDFTSRPIVGPGVTVSARELSRRPIRKDDGYFLFLDSAEPSLEITARAWAYHPAVMRVELNTLPPLRPVVKLRLTPNRNYTIPNQTTCLEGCAPAGSTLRLFCENDPRPLRLLYDYAAADGGLIRLYDPAESDQEGREFALLRRGEQTPEFFTVRRGTGEEGEWLMAAPLARECRKAGATVLPVSGAQADEAGRFFLPLRTMAVRSYMCRVFWKSPGGAEQVRSLELEPGRVTRLDLREND